LEGLELPVLVLGSKTQTLFGSEFGTGFESGTETRLFSELVTERGSQFNLFLELELELTYFWNWNWNLLISGTGIGT